jgi:hypothetical protein
MIRIRRRLPLARRDANAASPSLVHDAENSHLLANDQGSKKFG